MVLVGRELNNEKCINTSLLSVNINESFLKPSVVAHVKAIEICQKQNSNNPFAVNEDQIINDFNKTLNSLPCIYVPENHLELISVINIDKYEIKLITSEDSWYNILQGYGL